MGRAEQRRALSASRFEVIIYNKVVRDRVEQGRHHRHLDDGWADLHHEEFEAEDGTEARTKAERRYPASSGYVIVDVVKIEDE